MGHFDNDLVLEQETASRSEARFRGSFNDRWFIDRSLHGGQVLAAVVRALEASVDDPSRALRSVSHHYLIPAVAGPFTITVTIERSGRTLSNATVRVTQNDRLVGVSIAALGTDWEPLGDWDHTAMPIVGAPSDCPDPWNGTGGFCNLHRQFDYGLAMGPHWNDSATDSNIAARKATVSGGWLRLKQPQLIDAALAACLTDTWPPAPVMYISPDHPWMFPTIDLTVQLMRPLPLPDDPGNWHCLVVHTIETSRSGYVVQDTEVWSESGLLVARGRQHALCVPVRQTGAELDRPS